MELDTSNYGTKFEVNEATNADTLDFDGKADLAALKLIVDELNIDKLNFFPVELSRLSNLVNDVVKKSYVLNWLRKLM